MHQKGGGVGKKFQEPEPPRPYRGERLLERTWFVTIWVPLLTTVRWPRPNLSSPHSTNYIVWALNVRTQYHFWDRYKLSTYNWRRLWERLMRWHRWWIEKVPPLLCPNIKFQKGLCFEASVARMVLRASNVRSTSHTLAEGLIPPNLKKYLSLNRTKVLHGSRTQTYGETNYLKKYLSFGQSQSIA